jgi:hypothetical protein
MTTHFVFPGEAGLFPRIFAGPQLICMSMYRPVLDN